MVQSILTFYFQLKTAKFTNSFFQKNIQSFKARPVWGPQSVSTWSRSRVSILTVKTDKSIVKKVSKLTCQLFRRSWQSKNRQIDSLVSLNSSKPNLLTVLMPWSLDFQHSLGRESRSWQLKNWHLNSRESLDSLKTDISTLETARPLHNINKNAGISIHFIWLYVSPFC